MDEQRPDGDDLFQETLAELCEELVDEISLGVCFEIHRACRLGTLFLGYSDTKNDKTRAIVDRPGVDVFGHVPTKKQVDCICPNCSRNMAAQRFAPHLEKCMGMGRNSSRIASRRIANNTNNSVVGKRDSDESDDGNDSDWSSHADRRIKKIKKEKLTNSPRRVKIKNKNGDVGELSSTPESVTSYESMSTEDKKSLLLLTCGVISDHTHKMCTKSIKCPQHTDDQRRAVRLQLIGQTALAEGEEVHVDIDGFDDADSRSLRETLQWEISSNSSPTDSASTNNSSNSKKRSSGCKSLPGNSKKCKPCVSVRSSSQPSMSMAQHYDCP